MAAVATERCPWCGNEITHAKFLQIQAAMKSRLEKEITAQQQQLAKERQALEAERARLAKQIELARKQFDAQKKKEIADVRAILQKDRDAALLKKDAEFAREREALQKKISDMSRRVKKGGSDLAEGAELDLYEELRGAFPEDKIERVRGKLGEMLLHEIRYKNKSAGKILIDVTARASWQHAFLTKLRQTQSEIAADHAILSTGVFPSGKRELFVESGVIAVSPARVRALVEVLRKATIAMHVAKLSEAERSDKLGRLFRFITSPQFRKKLAEASDLTAEALEIDVQEKRAHDNVWKKRGTVLTRIRNVLRDIDTDVSAIVEAREESEVAETPLRPAAWRVTTK
jgi:hypothetical protein